MLAARNSGVNGGYGFRRVTTICVTGFPHSLWLRRTFGSAGTVTRSSVDSPGPLPVLKSGRGQIRWRGRNAPVAKVIRSGENVTSPVIAFRLAVSLPVLNGKRGGENEA